MRYAQTFRLAFAARGLSSYTDASAKTNKHTDDGDDEGDGDEGVDDDETTTKVTTTTRRRRDVDETTATI